MLIGVVCVVSLAAAILLCAGAGAFAGMAWLWILPLGFAGVFLLSAALWYGLLQLMAKCADTEKPQEKDSAFYRGVLRLTLEAVIPLLRVRIHTKGFEQALPQGRFLLVCNHLHDIDPAMLMQHFPDSQLAFIAKREVRQMALVGPFLKKTLGQFVNRENDREALNTILECIRLIKEDNASVAVFPEGYVSREHKLHPFRPGVFKIAQKAKVPVVVCTLRDTHTALAKVVKLQPADVHLHLVGIIPAEELENVTAVDVARRAYDMMVADLGPNLVLPLENTENT